MRPQPMPMFALAVAAALVCSAAAAAASGEQPKKQEADRQKLGEEIQLINKSLEGLMSELELIKREASGRLSKVKNRNSLAEASSEQQERIRQTKVSKFVLRRVAELESQSAGMRDEMRKLFEIRQLREPNSLAGRQEDHDFEPATPEKPQRAQQTTAAPPASTTAAEAQQLGFDLEALKRLGDEIEAQIEARQNTESVRGVHEQFIRLIDNMVQNYLGNMRRTIQRVNNFIDNRRPSTQAPQAPAEALAIDEQSRVVKSGEQIADELGALSKRFRDFSLVWAKTVGKQSSPLIDRIPPNGIAIWRDFWDTVRSQIRRINNEFRQVARDMARMVTGRVPAGGRVGDQPAEGQTDSLLYMDESKQDILRRKFQDFYEQLSSTINDEQKKLDDINKMSANNNEILGSEAKDSSIGMNLIEESDDEATRNELTRNAALRQHIQQEINVFGSIFDIMGAFIQRLRDSASTIRDVLNPGAPNNNDAVTPGPEIKPQVDSLLQETVNSQRVINSQAKPVLLPDNRRPLDARRR